MRAAILTLVLVLGWIVGVRLARHAPSPRELAPPVYRIRSLPWHPAPPAPEWRHT